MDKNSVIGFILIAVIFIGFTVFQTGQARKRAELQAQLDSKGFRTKVMRATECSDDLNGTRRIIKRILETKGAGQ